MSIITGAHSIIYSKKPEVDRAFMSDVLKLPYIGSGDGWLIFGLPPWQAALHDSAKNNLEEFYLITDDIKALVTEMKKHKVNCSPVQRQPWGLLTKVKLPRGGNLKVFSHLQKAIILPIFCFLSFRRSQSAFR
ncbi:MAG: extradiol dioxygenase [Spirochaetia bacterium]